MSLSSAEGGQREPSLTIRSLLVSIPTRIVRSSVSNVESTEESNGTVTEPSTQGPLECKRQWTHIDTWAYTVALAEYRKLVFSHALYFYALFLNESMLTPRSHSGV